jgi:hypothetical protein
MRLLRGKVLAATIAAILGAAAASQQELATAVCKPGTINKAENLNGGPTMMEVADAAQCRALCEDHELCGAFVMVSRVHVRRASLFLSVSLCVRAVAVSVRLRLTRDRTTATCARPVCLVRQEGCLKENINTPTSKTNLPRLFPSAQCFLKAPLAGSVATTVDATNCSCAGMPRPACPTGSTGGGHCAELCPAAQLTNSHGVTCGRRRGFSLGEPLPSPSAAHCEGSCSSRDDCVAWSWTTCGSGAAGSCSLKNLVGRIEDAVEAGDATTFSCTGTKKYEAPADDLARRSSASTDSDGSGSSPQNNNLTTWGYIQNPYHRRRHESGIIRAHDLLNGVAHYAGASGPNDPLLPAPSATIFVAVGRRENPRHPFSTFIHHFAKIFSGQTQTKTENRGDHLRQPRSSGGRCCALRRISTAQVRKTNGPPSSFSSLQVTFSQHSCLSRVCLDELWDSFYLM